jgi:WD40 repeat protein
LIATPGSRPFTALAQPLVEEFAGDTEATSGLLRFEETDIAVSLMTRWRQKQKHALVIVDQFEELFTQNPSEVQERFTELLGRLALEADVHVLLSMRDDFLLYCHDHQALSPIFSELTPIKAPVGAALRRAIVQPALKCGYRFEDEALVDEVLSEVEEERGALPMLAFAAARLWSKRERESGQLTREAYKEIGGVSGALAQHAEATLERIGSDRIPVVRELFRNLVTAQGTRAARDREELLSVFDPEKAAGRGTGRFNGHRDSKRPVGEGIEGRERSKRPVPLPARVGGGVGDRATASRVLDTLIDARLLTSYEVPPAEDEDTGHRRIEIIHESLLTNWPRLVRWQSQDSDSALLRDELRQVAQVWDQHDRSTDLLWTGTAFQEYQLWRERYPGGLSATEEAFGEAMTRHAERRKRRRRIALTAVIAALLIVVGVIGGFWRRSVAETRRAEASKLLALGELEIDVEPTAGVAYALKSLELRDTPEARILALKALWQGPTAVILPPAQPETKEDRIFFHRIAFSPDGKWLAAAGSGGNGQLWSEDGQTYRWFGGHEGEPRSWPRISFGQESDVLVSGADRTIRFWSVPGARELRTLEFEQRTGIQPVGPVGAQLFTSTHVDKDRFQIQSRPLTGGEPIDLGYLEENNWQVDPNGRWLAYAKGPALYAVPVKGLPEAQPRLVGRHDEAFPWLMFTPDGKRIASLGEAGDIRIWSLTTGSSEPLRVLENAQAKGWLAFDPSATLLAAKNDIRTVHMWNLAGPPDAEPLALRRGRAILMRTTESAFHPSGQWLATANGANLSFWPMSRRYPYVLPGRWQGDPGQLTFTSDGRWLASAPPSGELRLWPLSSEAGEESRVLLEEGLGEGWPDVVEDTVGHRLLVGGSSGRLWLVPLDGGQPRAMATGLSADLMAVAVDPQGQRAAVATYFSPGAEKVIHVIDLESGAVQVLGPPEGDTTDLEFTADGRLLSTGGYGLVRWSLEDGSHEVLNSRGTWRMTLSSDRRFVLVPGDGDRMAIHDLVEGSSRDVPSHGQAISIGPTLDPTGRFIVSGDTTGVVRVGPVSGEEPHLLLGHEELVGYMAFSPDSRWLATSSDDFTIRIWPMPDMDKPPFHTLPYGELLEKLRSLTNLRVVEDADSPTGWKLEIGPFPGWETVPTW